MFPSCSLQCKRQALEGDVQIWRQDRSRHSQLLRRRGQPRPHAGHKLVCITPGSYVATIVIVVHVETYGYGGAKVVQRPLYIVGVRVPVQVQARLKPFNLLNVGGRNSARARCRQWRCRVQVLIWVLIFSDDALPCHNGYRHLVQTAVAGTPIETVRIDDKLLGKIRLLGHDIGLE